MVSSRQAYLLRYWEDACCPSPTTPLRSAIAGGLLNGLSLEETVQLILNDASIDQRLREKVLRRLIDEAGSTPIAVRDVVVRKLLDAMEDTPHPRKSTVGYFLERLYDSMPRATQRAIVRAFFESPPGMRKRAYKLLRRDWHPTWEADVRRCWEKWHELECALVIVDHFDSAFVVQHIDRLADDLNGTHIVQLYLRACAVDESHLVKLRKLDGITYAYVAARLSKSIHKRVARQLLREYRQDARLGILAWSLGKLGHWDLLVELSEGVETLEEDMRRRDMARWGILD